MGPLRRASVPPVGPQRTLHPPSHCVGVQGLSQWLLCPEVGAQAGAGRMGGGECRSEDLCSGTTVWGTQEQHLTVYVKCVGSEVSLLCRTPEWGELNSGGCLEEEASGVSL